MEGSSRDHANIDLSSLVATGRDTDEYTVSVQEAAEMFSAAGLPRTERAIQRYCKKSDLTCVPVDTIYGSKYLITRPSIERLILQKQQAQQFAADPLFGNKSRLFA